MEGRGSTEFEMTARIGLHQSGSRQRATATGPAEAVGSWYALAGSGDGHRSQPFLFSVETEAIGVCVW